MQTIYFDECGYTGNDLFQRDQRFFAIASHAFSEQECQGLRAEFFGKVQQPKNGSAELKHTTLKKHHKAAVVAFMKRVLPTGKVRIGLADERFALLAKLVDWAIEPVMFEDGLNLYEDGGSAALSTVLYPCLRLDERFLEQLLRLFQDLARTPSQERFDAFAAAAWQDRRPPVLAEALTLVRYSTMRLTVRDFESLPPGALDLSLSMALGLVCEWRSAGVSSMRIVHDESTNMARQRDVWSALVAPDAPQANVGRHGATVPFPLGAGATDFVSSPSSIGVQVADVIAGATCRGFLSLQAAHGDDYSEALGRVLQDNAAVFATLIIPQPEVQRTPRPPGTVDSLDYLTQRIASAGVALR